MISTLPKTSNISIIIPTFNEESNVPSLAANLKGAGFDRIIVDGGSSDNTVKLARDHGFRVIEGAKNRAAQLNLGAAKATGALLLFLHADTRLPSNFASAISEAMMKEGVIAGAFRLAIKNPTPGLHFIAACANLRSLLFQLPYGDQAIFIKKSSFFELKGFPDLPIMEDYMFIKNAQVKGQIVLLPERATTSARRWRRLGVVQTTVINQLIILGFHLKVSPERLALFYRR